MTAVLAPNDAVAITRTPEEAYWLDVELMEVLVTHEQAGGKYDVLRCTVAPGGGPPPHRHSREDEMFYVAEGTFEFIDNDTKFVAGAGRCVFLPRGSVHNFKNVGQTYGTLIVFATPSGFAEFVADAGSPAADRSVAPATTPAALVNLAQMCETYGMELLPVWQTKREDSPLKPGRDLWVMGLHVRTLLGNPETNGAFAVAEITAHPGDFVPPHVHFVEDEMFYVLEGTCEFDLPGGTITAEQGTFVHIPKQTPHGFRNSGTEDTKLLDIHTPGGFENFFAELGCPWPDRTKKPADANADVERFTRIAHAYGMAFAERA